jgi:hypothetical protein
MQISDAAIAIVPGGTGNARIAAAIVVNSPYLVKNIFASLSNYLPLRRAVTPALAPYA